MPRRPLPSELRSRLETARLDTLALLRAIDQALVPPADLPQAELHQLFELDADCAEALWALDQPQGALNVEAMVRDTLDSLERLPGARDTVRARLRSHPRLQDLETTIRSGLDPASIETGCILSFHDFEGIPAGLESTLRDMVARNPFAAKAVCRAGDLRSRWPIVPRWLEIMNLA